MYKITSYDTINGHKTTSREKFKLLKSVNDIDKLQKRAEQIWNASRKERDKLAVYIHYINLNHRNPKSENIGKEGFKLEKWM